MALFWWTVLVLGGCALWLFAEPLEALVCRGLLLAYGMDAAGMDVAGGDVAVEPTDLTTVLAVLDADALIPSLCVMGVLLVGLVLGSGLDPRTQYARTLGMAELLAHNVANNPALLPIVRWERSLLAEPLDRGPWMCARQPLQFAAEHKLLLWPNGEYVPRDELLAKDGLANTRSALLTGQATAILDREACRAAFCAQFGPLFTSGRALPLGLRSLACAFILFGLEEKSRARALLSACNESFYPPRAARGFRLSATMPFIHLPCAARHHYLLGVPEKEREVEELFAHPRVLEVITPHNHYVSLVLLALYAFARQKGVLTTAEFLWLRPVNRTLFYLLNNYGRRTVWVECAGPWVHYMAENAMARNHKHFQGRDIPEEVKCVDEAVRGLERALRDEGWLSSTTEY